MPFAGYTNFADCVSKNKDKGDPDAYCGSIQAKVEEANRIFGKEQEPEQVASLTTPDAGNIETDEPKDLTSPQGSSKEADNPHVDTETPQDQAEPEDKKDQAKPDGQEVSPDSEIKTNDKYGKLNGDKYEKNEEDQKDEKRDEHQGLEYNGETYHKVKSIEYEDEIYVQKDDKEEASEDDLEYEDDIYKKADEDTLELENDNDYYIKDEEQAPTIGDVPISDAPTTAIDIPALNPISESIIIKESNGRYRKYSIFEVNEEEDSDEKMEKLRAMKKGAKEQEEESTVEEPAEVEETPVIETPTSEAPIEEPEIEPVELKPEPASEEVKAVEKIIVKENGKLKFKSVYTEVKKKLRNKTQ